MQSVRAQINPAPPQAADAKEHASIPSNPNGFAARDAVRPIISMNSRLHAARPLPAAAGFMPVLLRGLLPLAGLLLVLTGCRHSADVPGSKLLPPPISENAFATHEKMVAQLKGRLSTSFVYVDGDDIQLPAEAGPSAPQLERTYSFYVWAYHSRLSPARTSLMEMLGKEFRLEVVGAKAKFILPNNRPADDNQRLNALFPNANKDWFLQGRDVIEVQISSRDIQRSFSIVAWFPEDWQRWEEENRARDVTNLKKRSETNHNRDLDSALGLEKNPYGLRKDVKVYHGSLRTSIQMISPEEISASFGRHFSEYFSVGRVFFRNQDRQKRLAVYTTSMKANVLMYRKRVEGKKQRELSSNEIADIQWQYTNSAPVTIPRELAAYCITKALSADLPATAQRQSKAGSLVDSVWPMWADANTKVAAATQAKFSTPCQNLISYVFELVDQESNRLGKEAQAERGGANDSVRAALQALSAARAAAKPTGTNQDQFIRVEHTLSGIQNDVGGQGYEPWSEYTAAYEKARALRTETIAQLPVLDGKLRTELGESLQQLEQHLWSLARVQWLRPALVSPAGSLSPNPPAPPSDWPQNLLDLQARIRLAAMGLAESSTPMDKELEVLVRPDSRALAFSRNAKLQRKLAEEGMLWRDVYRPMTFQAVLNSLIFIHEQSWESHTVKFMESAARVAGGIAAMGTVFNELTSQGYTEAVNVFSTILVPEVRAWLTEDLNKHIRNLGEMGMDSIIEIPPNGAVDRYVFFPRGPIYNHVDEFNISDPGYIVEIDAADLSAEALLIDDGMTVRSGQLTSEALVGRALNEGRENEATQVLKQAELQDKLRRFDLVSLSTRLEELLGGASAQDKDCKDWREKTGQAQRLVAEFEQRNGPDKTGLVASLLRKYHVDFLDAPPFFAPLPSLKLPAGLASTLLALPITDDRTPLANLSVTVVSNSLPGVIPTEWVEFDYPRRGETGPIQLRIVTKDALSNGEPTRVVLTLRAKDDSDHFTDQTLEVIVQPRAEAWTLDGTRLEPNDGKTNSMSKPLDIQTLLLKLPLLNADAAGASAVILTNPDLQLVSANKEQAKLSVAPADASLLAEWKLDASAITNFPIELKVALKLAHDQAVTNAFKLSKP